MCPPPASIGLSLETSTLQIDAVGVSDHRFQSLPLPDKCLTYVSSFKPLLVWRIEIISFQIFSEH